MATGHNNRDMLYEVVYL